MTRIELPWPHRLLWPNETERRGNQHRKRELRRNARTFGWTVTAQALGPKIRQFQAPEGGLEIRIEATPPMRPGPRADEDNLKSALKHFLDGIAQALGVNDRSFRFAPMVWNDKDGAGKVVISF